MGPLGVGGGGGGSVPIVKTRTSGNVTVSSTSFVAVDAAMDITIPAAAGDTVEIGVSYLPGDTSNNILMLDVGTVVSGSVVRRWGGSEGIAGLFCNGASRDGLSAVVPRVLTSADISGGNVTLRLLARVASNSRAIAANSFESLDFWAKNHSR